MCRDMRFPGVRTSIRRLGFLESSYSPGAPDIPLNRYPHSACKKRTQHAYVHSCIRAAIVQMLIDRLSTGFRTQAEAPRSQTVFSLTSSFRASDSIVFRVVCDSSVHVRRNHSRSDKSNRPIGSGKHLLRPRCSPTNGQATLWRERDEISGTKDLFKSVPLFELG